MVEHGTENAGVDSSSLSLGTTNLYTDVCRNKPVRQCTVTVPTTPSAETSRAALLSSQLLTAVGKRIRLEWVLITRVQWFRPLAPLFGKFGQLYQRKWLSGRAPPCQGGGREFESRLPLHSEYRKDPVRCRVFLISGKKASGPVRQFPIPPAKPRIRALSTWVGNAGSPVTPAGREYTPSCNRNH